MVTVRFSLEDTEKALNADNLPGNLKTMVVL
jgi:hypothetical protein